MKMLFCIKFAETCRVGVKSAKEENLQKYLPIFTFISKLSLLIVNILRVYK